MASPQKKATESAAGVRQQMSLEGGISVPTQRTVVRKNMTIDGTNSSKKVPRNQLPGCSCRWRCGQVVSRRLPTTWFLVWKIVFMISWQFVIVALSISLLPGTIQDRSHLLTDRHLTCCKLAICRSQSKAAFPSQTKLGPAPSPFP